MQHASVSYVLEEVRRCGETLQCGWLEHSQTTCWLQRHPKASPKRRENPTGMVIPLPPSQTLIPNVWLCLPEITFMQGGFPLQGLPQGNKLQTPIYMFCQPYLQWDAEGGLQGVRALPTWKTKPGEENPAKKSSPSFSISLHKLIVGKKKTRTVSLPPISQPAPDLCPPRWPKWRQGHKALKSETHLQHCLRMPGAFSPHQCTLVSQTALEYK